MDTPAVRRALVTGSTDGIGARIADLLERKGMDVVRHARNAERAAGCRGDVAVGDFASLQSTRDMAEALAARQPFDVVVHNAGWSTDAEERPLTEDGLEQTFEVNVLAAYVLTALLPLPQRLIYVSSDAIRDAQLDLTDLQHERTWSGGAAYAESKLALTALALGVARRYPDVVVTAVHPGWVRTKMAGDAAPLTIDEGADTPVWLATSDDPAALQSGAFFHERRVVRLNDQAYDDAAQDAVIDACAALTGVDLP